MKVSVLIPTYNSERYLPECLDSVLAQDFGGMEILISDDCSTDGTLQVIQAYAARDARVRWWQNPNHLGLVANHNACLRQARGKYVKFIHADDKLLCASAIRKLAAVLDEHPSAVLAGCRPHLTGGKSGPRLPAQGSSLQPGRRLMVVCLEQNGNIIGQPTLTLFHRSAARRGFDDRFIGHLDFDMWFHLLEQGDFFYLDEPLATWRVHAAQLTATHEHSGAARHEHLAFMETCYAKPWLRAAATDRMLFAQIYYLKKTYGRQARHLTSAMLSQLTPHRYAWQWLKHKAARPWQNLARHLGQGRWRPARQMPAAA